jgi:pSer/pThr/pTyr-binding forkhead associated (FHA) protein
MPLRFRILPGEASSADPGPAVERTVDVPDGVTEVRFGRREGLEVILPFPSLSGLHARLVRQGDAYFLSDLGSRNGTVIEGEPLPAHGRAPLRAGQRFRLAHIWLAFDGLVPAGSTMAEGTGTLARRLVRDLFAGRPGGGDVARLTVTSGPEAGRVLRLEKPDHTYVVGRESTCDLMLAAGDLSRAHASFVRRWEGVFVRDHESKNGVLVAGQRVQGEHRLHDGDQLAMGAITFSFVDPEDRYLRQLESQPSVAAPVVPAISSVNLSHPDIRHPPSALELAPHSGAFGSGARVPPGPGTRLIIALAALVLFGAIGLLVYLIFLP